MPTPAKSALPFSLESYDQHRGEISLQMSHFFVCYLRELYRHFDGDLALVIVLGEIAHHNMSAHFTSETGGDHDLLKRMAEDETLLARMPGCNAYSLAAATGMPRETIRRKIAQLEKLGWVERAERREVRITKKVAEHFQPDFNINLLAGLLKTADRIRGLLAGVRSTTASNS